MKNTPAVVEEGAVEVTCLSSTRVKEIDVAVAVHVKAIEHAFSILIEARRAGRLQ